MVMNEHSQLVEKDKSKPRDKQSVSRFLIFIYALVYGFALQISSRAQPQYIYAYLKRHSEFNDTRNKTNNDSEKVCSSSSNEDIYQQEASRWSWYYQVAEYGLSIPIIMVIGPLSDGIGRKPVLLWNGVFVFLSYSMRTLVVFLNWNLYYFLIGILLSGLSGSFYTFNLTMFALIADVTPKNKDRSFNMVVFDAMLGLGVTCSQIITGYLIELTSFTYPFLMTTGFVLLYIIIVYMTLTEATISKKTVNKVTIFSSIGQTLSLFDKQQRKKNTFKQFVLLYVIYILYYFPFDAFVNIRTLYQLGPPFCWSSEHIGWYGAAEDLELFILATFILKAAHQCTNDGIMATLGLLSSASCFLLFGFTNSDWMIYGVTAIGLLRIYPIPLIKAVLSRLVSEEKQGVLFSNISVITAVCAVGGSTLFNNIYRETRPINKGFVFFVMAGFQMIAALFMIFVVCRMPKDNIQKNLDVSSTNIQRTEHPIGVQ